MNRREKTRAYAHAGTLTRRGSTPRTCAAPGQPRIPLQHDQQAGFTIVEMLVAVVIFAVGLTAIAGMQTRSIEQSTFSDQMSMRVNDITHWAETLTRMPVMDETLGLDGGIKINVQIDNLFKKTNMCEYGKTCDWSYVDEVNAKKPHVLRQRITQGYPLPNLVMVEIEAAPKGMSTADALRRTVRSACVRSTRWN